MKNLVVIVDREVAATTTEEEVTGVKAFFVNTYVLEVILW